MASRHTGPSALSATALCRPAIQALVAEVVDPARRQQANAHHLQPPAVVLGRDIGHTSWAPLGFTVN